MTRLLSALALLPIVVGVIWWLPAFWTVALAEVVVLVAFLEYAKLAEGGDAGFPRVTAAVAVLTTSAVFGLRPSMLPAVLMSALVAIGVTQLAHRSQPAPLASVAAASFGVFYLALPVGSIAALRTAFGPEPVLLLLLTVMASDTAQYYGGRQFGRRPLAPAISPKKTVAGAVFGLVAGVLVMWWLGGWWLSMLHPGLRIVLGAALAGLGIAGDLFESSLKRRAQVKDASTLIPGHGGLLDRLDGLLFAAPVYYTVLQLAR